MQKGLQKLILNQKGGVSIYVSMAIMTVLMLITLSFATVMAQNYEQTGDSQLNTQAFYAAESGIADARARLLGLIDAYGRGEQGALPLELRDIDDNDTGTGLLSALQLLSPGLRAVDTNAAGTRIVFKDDSATAIHPLSNIWVLTLNGSGNWESAQITLSGSPSSTFGQAIALNGDCLYIGDPGSNGGNGSIVPYEYSSLSSSWNAVTSPIITGSGAGSSLALSETGNLLAIGLPNEGSGQGAVDIADAPSGSSCALTVRNRIATPLDITIAGTTPHFGATVTFSKSNRIAVGAPDAYVNGSGAVYIYNVTTTTTAITTAEVLGRHIQGASSEALGKVLALDGDTLAIGVPSSNKVYIYENTWPGGWNQVDMLNKGGQFGASLGLGDDFLVVSAPQAKGRIYLYQYKDDNNPWANEIDTRDGQATNDEFGQPVILRGRNLTVGTKGGGPFRFKIEDFADYLNLQELTDRLAAECVNKGDPDTDFYNFDLVDNEDEIYYSCLSINLTPEALYYSKIEQDRSLGVLLKSIEPQPPIPLPDGFDDRDLERLVIRWYNSGNIIPTDFNTGSVFPKLPPYSAWNYHAPVLEVQITAMNRDAGYTRQDLKDHTKVVYLYPSAVSSPNHNHHDWSSITSGDIIKARCGSYLAEDERTSVPAGNCTVVIKDLMADIYPEPEDPDHTNKIIFHVRMRSLYAPAHITLLGYSYSSNSLPPNASQRTADLKPLADRRVRFRDIQAVIEATGHAGDVQVRLEERFRIHPAYDYPEHGIYSAQSICKIFISNQDQGTIVTGGSLANPPSGLTDLDDKCHPGF